MAINDDLHRYKDVLKKQISHAFRIYLSIAIILSPLYLMNTANAGSIGGWTYSNPISKGASAVISATKNVVINGKDFIKIGSATITPTASQVAKTFGKTAGALALTVAIEQMLGAVDWVLDPDNNSIKYTPKATTEPQNYEQYRWFYGGGSAFGGDQYFSYSLDPAAICNLVLAASSGKSPWYYNRVSVSSFSQTQINCYVSSSTTSFNGGAYVQRDRNPIYDPSATAPTDNQPKSLPLSTIATRVIDNAKTGEPKAQAAIMQAATDILAEAETDSTKARPITNQLEQSAETKPADAVDALKQNTGTAKTVNPDGSVAESKFEMPVACTWMPLVCQAASVVITKPGEWAEYIKAAYNDSVDYFKEEPTNKDPEELQIEQPEFEAEQVNLQGSTDCPQDSVSFSLMGKSYTLDMPYQPVCNALDFFRPAVLAVGAITSAYIIAGIRTKEDET